MPQARRQAAVLSLAARFAAKEAFGKALGSGLAGLSLRDMAVMNNPLGKPEMRLIGSAEAALQQIGGTRVFISLSHEKQAVLAMCVIEGRPGSYRQRWRVTSRRRRGRQHPGP